MASKQGQRPYLPSQNEIRSSDKAPGRAVAEALDSVSESIAQTNAAIADLKTGVTTVTKTVTTMQAAAASTAQTQPPNDTSFDAIEDGTNTQADMVVGDGATLTAQGAGIINATEINSVAITGTPSAGYVPIASGSNSATWSLLGMITTLDCNSDVGLVGGLDCGSA